MSEYGHKKGSGYWEATEKEQPRQSRASIIIPILLDEEAERIDPTFPVGFDAESGGYITCINTTVMNGMWDPLLHGNKLSDIFDIDSTFSDKLRAFLLENSMSQDQESIKNASDNLMKSFLRKIAIILHVDDPTNHNYTNEELEDYEVQAYMTESNQIDISKSARIVPKRGIIPEEVLKERYGNGLVVIGET